MVTDHLQLLSYRLLLKLRDAGVNVSTLALANTAATCALLLFLLALKWLLHVQGRRSSAVAGRMPPGPWPWPIVGNLPAIAGTQVHRTAAALSKKYSSPLISLRLGSIPMMVACTADMAREFLHTHDSLFCNRPRLGMADFLLFGEHNSIAFEDSGPRWRELRKLWTTQLLSQAMMAKNQHVRLEEITHMLATIKAEAEAGEGGGGGAAPPPAMGVNVLNCLVHYTGNVIGRLVISQRLFDSVQRPHKLHDVVDEAVRLMFTPLVGDCVPMLSWLDRTTKKKMGESRIKVEELVGSMVEERVKMRALQTMNGSSQIDDILDVLLKEAGGVLDDDSRAFIYDTVLEMFIAGMDTTVNTVTWAMAELLHNPKEMEKVQKELKEVVGLDRIVEESDLPKLDYLRAVIKEVFRLHPVAVMMIPHVCKEDAKVAGYFIPAKTRVSINLWAIGRDPSVWESPEQFLPQRFVDSDIDSNGQHFGLLPFGSGRRMCPGRNQGLRAVEFSLANLIHCFNWSPLPGQTIDLAEANHSVSALTLATPLVAVPKFRLKIADFPRI